MACYLSLISVCLSRQRIEPCTVHALSLCVVCGQTYAALHGVGLETWNVAAVERVEHALVGHVVAHTVEQFDKLRIGLPVHLVQFHHSILRSGQSAAAEKIWCGIILPQNLPLLVLNYRRKLSEIAYHEQLNTAERSAVAPAETQHIVYRIEHVGTHHTYLVYHEQVDSAYHSLLLLAHAHLRTLRAELGTGHVRRERQLEERVHRHTAGIESSYARGRHHDGTLRRALLQIAQKGSLSRSGPTGEKKTCVGGFDNLPRQLCFLVHDVRCF